MNMSNLWEAWPIVGPWRLSPFSGGTNKSTWRADTVDGKSYVLRLITNSSSIPHVLYEAKLLEALSDKRPPFLLPLPLKTHQGEIVTSFEQEIGVSAFAMLSHLLPGHVPERDDITIATHAATTLAWLDHALVALPETFASHENSLQQTYGQLACSHPLVPEPLLAVEQLPVNREDVKQIQIMLSAVIHTVDDLYQRLPQQLLHCDYCPDNILVNEKQITAVLDFEFAGVDLRVLELCVALSWWPVNLLGTGKEWDMIDAFGNAYIEHFPLSEEEILAFPSIWRLRDATSFVHRMGRYMAGIETDERIQDRVQHSLWREAWLATNQEKLVQHALKWGKENNVQED